MRWFKRTECTHPVLVLPVGVDAVGVCLNDGVSVVLAAVAYHRNLYNVII